MDTCKTCRWMRRNPSDPLNPRSVVCVRYPPTAHIVPIQSSGGVLQPAVFSTYPVISEENISCGEYIASKTS